MNIKTIICAGCALLASFAANAQPNVNIRPNETVLLYADKLTDKADIIVAKKVTSAGLEMVHDNGISTGETVGDNGNLGNISTFARFDLYFPENPNGQMIIVCPGGGYEFVSSYNEGIYVADWMLDHGITVAVLKYRLPNGNCDVPLEDVQNTFRYCREHAADWGISQIGVMGFSAGGHLAVTTSVMYADAQTRPDFSVFIYPVVTFEESITHQGTHDNLIGKRSDITGRRGKSWSEWETQKKAYEEAEKAYSLENQVDGDNAPVFIAHCTDDGTVPVENSLRLYRALVDHNVPVEMHIFPSGGHGWGFSAEKYVGEGDWFRYARGEFLTSLDRWLASLRTAK